MKTHTSTDKSHRDQLQTTEKPGHTPTQTLEARENTGGNKWHSHLQITTCKEAKLPIQNKQTWENTHNTQ
jgi:hypothetical protein